MSKTGRLVAVASLVAAAVFPIAVVAQSEQPSLADVARREAERRKTAPRAEKVYTNTDTQAGRPLTTGAAAPKATAKAEGEAGQAGQPGAAGAKEGKDANVPADTKGQGEPKGIAEALAQRILDLKEQISRDTVAGQRLSTQVDELNNGVLSAFDAQRRDELVRQRDEVLTEYRKLATGLDELKQVLADLEAEAARKAAAPQK